jgi:hypothetical protein
VEVLLPITASLNEYIENFIEGVSSEKITYPPEVVKERYMQIQLPWFSKNLKPGLTYIKE